MDTPRLVLPVVLFAALAAMPALATQIPSQAQGLDAETAYGVGEVDFVNLLNGALTLRIPFPALDVGPELSVGLTLVHNQTRWEPDAPATCRFEDEVRDYTRIVPDSRFEHNAGLNWQVSLGRLEIFWPPLPGSQGAAGTYFDPSGGEHTFGPVLHPGPGTTEYGNQQGLGFTTDGTYIRVRDPAHPLSGDPCLDTGCVQVEMPDGQIHEFNEVGGAWRPRRIRDRWGNAVVVTYLARAWAIVDSNGRAMRVEFASDGDAFAYEKVVTIEVPEFEDAGDPAVYTFQYLENQSTWRHRYVDPHCDAGEDPSDPPPSPTVTVDVLRRVVQPDGSYWEMTHFLSATGEPPGTVSGAIRRLRFPTGGAAEWTFRDYVLRSEGLVPAMPGDGGIQGGGWANRHRGVATKTHYDRDGATIGTWTYDQAESLVTGSGGFVASCYSKTTVTDPLGNATEHFFSTAQSELHYGWSYGLPFSRCGDTATASEQDAQGGGPFLSQRVYRGGVDPNNLLRTVLVEYDSDGDESGVYQAKNHRLVYRKVVFHDDTPLGETEPTTIETFFSDFDGFGHLREVRTVADFESTPDRRVVTRYNRTRRTYDFDPDTGTFGVGHDFNMLGPNGAWILDTYDLQRVREGGQEILVETCFDKGLPIRTRRLAALLPDGAGEPNPPTYGGSRAPIDLVTFLVRDGSGRVTSERQWGGDTQASIDEDYDYLCQMNAPAVDPQYRTDHTYSTGVLATSTAVDACDGTPVLTLADRTIDPTSGLVAASRDAAGVETTFRYDAMGRLTGIEPTGDAWTTYEYQLPTTGNGSLANRLTMRRCANGVATCTNAAAKGWESHVYDGLGRRVRQEVLYPPLGANAPDFRVWTYNGLGWVTSESTWGGATTTTFTGYDPFGRAGTVTQPDGKETDFTYKGERIRVRGSDVQILVGTTPQESRSHTQEHYDGLGRLVEVCEGRQALAKGCTQSDGEVLTRYRFDLQDNLTEVLGGIVGGTPAQTRTFVYDGRGFLTSETHPEIGSGGNQTTTYTYDARGNALTRGLPGTAFDLAYTYDATGRLVAIHEDASDRPLKTFGYARANSGGEKRAGKLAQARRYNYRPLDGGADDTVVVTQEYRYDGTVGRVAERQTRVTNLASAGHEAFTTGFTWDSTGNPASITYPDCLGATCPGVEPARTVTHGYTYGFLSSIPGVAPDLDYTAGGMLRKITHANGVDEEIAIHPSTRMARPHKISTTAAPAWDTGTYAYDGSGNIEAIGTLSFEYDRLHRLVSGDAMAGGTKKTQTVSYDRMGNVMSLTTDDVLRTTTTALGTNHMFDGTYDAAGNLTAIALDGVGYQYGYDALSMMSTLQSGADARVFVYDADDERILTLDCNAPNDCEDPATHETWTLRGLGGKVLRVYDRPRGDDFTWQRDYVYRNGQPLATIEPTTGGASRAIHLHLDHLGSVRQVTDAVGAQVALHNYYPFGEEATSASQDGVMLKFTGHERDAAGDVDYMHARYCSPILGRFLTVDPENSATMENPRTWNRYTYGLNSPATFLDPDGKAARSGIKFLWNRAKHIWKTHVSKAAPPHKTRYNTTDMRRVQKLGEKTVRRPDRVDVQSLDGRNVWQREFNREIGENGERINVVVTETVHEGTEKVITSHAASVFKEVLSLIPIIGVYFLADDAAMAGAEALETAVAESDIAARQRYLEALVDSPEF